MRDLKFRTWSKLYKQWCGGTNYIDGVWLGWICRYGKDIMTQDVILEQYTGLKDKNGKEIYEGDIVRTTDRVTAKGLIFPIGVVEFKQQAFWICNVPSERPDFTHNETLLEYWETDLEVIGNVHENKELLGGEE